ncbi:Transmembrane protein [Plasmodiophora brassicae]
MRVNTGNASAPLQLSSPAWFYANRSFQISSAPLIQLSHADLSSCTMPDSASGHVVVIRRDISPCGPMSIWVHECRRVSCLAIVNRLTKLTTAPGAMAWMWRPSLISTSSFTTVPIVEIGANDGARLDSLADGSRVDLNPDDVNPWQVGLSGVGVNVVASINTWHSLANLAACLHRAFLWASHHPTGGGNRLVPLAILFFEFWSNALRALCNYTFAFGNNGQGIPYDWMRYCNTAMMSTGWAGTMVLVAMFTVAYREAVNGVPVGRTTWIVWELVILLVVALDQYLTLYGILRTELSSAMVIVLGYTLVQVPIGVAFIVYGRRVYKMLVMNNIMATMTPEQRQVRIQFGQRIVLTGVFTLCFIVSGIAVNTAPTTISFMWLSQVIAIASNLLSTSKIISVRNPAPSQGAATTEHVHMVVLQDGKRNPSAASDPSAPKSNPLASSAASSLQKQPANASKSSASQA